MKRNFTGLTFKVGMILNLVQESDPEVDEIVSTDWVAHVYISRRQFLSPCFHHSAESHSQIYNAFILTE